MTGSSRSLLASALTMDLDWRSVKREQLAGLRRAAADDGVTRLLWRKLEGATGSAQSLRAVFEPEVRAAATRDLFLKRELHSVLDRLAAENIQVLVTKGTALAYTVYEEPWLRPRTDTDLLVRRADVQAAGQLLAGCGYSRSDALSTGELVSHQVAFERTDEHEAHHVIDLHWKIVNPHVVADALSFEELWERSVPAPAIGPSARVPSTVHGTALGCVHRLAHHHGHDRLIWLYDLLLLTSAMGPGEWIELRELACRRRIAGLCLDGLRAARSALGSVLPHDVESALAAAAPSEPSKIYIEGSVTRGDVLISDMRALGSWRARLRLLREHVFPPAAFMRVRYGDQSWPLPALYVHRLITGASKWIRS